MEEKLFLLRHSVVITLLFLLLRSHPLATAAPAQPELIPKVRHGKFGCEKKDLIKVLNKSLAGTREEDTLFNMG